MGYGECLENGISAGRCIEQRTGRQPRGAVDPEGSTRGCCGMQSNNTVGVWTSKDLSHGSWKRASQLRMSSDGWPRCTYYRSHAAYSKATQKYVLWLNAEPGSDSNCTACDDPVSGRPTHCYLAGTSDSPVGPFAYHGIVPVRYTHEGGVGDFELFVDDDGTGYALYKRTGAAPGVYGHHMTLQQLTPDFLGVVESGSVGMQAFAEAPLVEAPAMFKRRGTYYALFGKCCAFCAHGSGIGVWTSGGTPLGPWVPRGNIGCTSKAIADQQFCGCASATARQPLPLPLTRRLAAAVATRSRPSSIRPTTAAPLETPAWLRPAQARSHTPSRTASSSSRHRRARASPPSCGRATAGSLPAAPPSSRKGSRRSGRTSVASKPGCDTRCCGLLACRPIYRLPPLAVVPQAGALGAGLPVLERLTLRRHEGTAAAAATGVEQRDHARH